MSLVFQLLANALVNAAMFAMLAVGFGLIYRSIRVFHLAYGAIFLLSGFLFHFLVTVAGLGWWIAGIATVAMSALIGLALEVGFYSKFYQRGVPNATVMVASLGLGLVIENALALGYGNEIQTLPRDAARTVSLGSASLTSIQLGGMAVCVAMLFGLAAAHRLRFFKILKVMGENPELLEIHGWKLPHYRLAAVALGTAIAAVPACFTMLDVGMDVHSGMNYVLIAAVAVLVGGVTRMDAWVLGGVALALIQSLVVWKLSAKWMELVAFVILLVILLFRRGGFLGVRLRTEEL